MGRYFSRIELIGGLIPGPEDFARVIDVLDAAAHANRKTHCVTLIGSTIRDRTNGQRVGGGPRSDIDCVVIHNTTHRNVVATYAHAMGLAAKLCVPLNILHYHVSSLIALHHDVGPGFAKHILRSAERGGLLLGNLADLFEDFRISSEDEAFTYVSRKKAGFERNTHKYAHMNEAERTRYLSKLIEAPVHVVRRLLVARDLLSGDDSKTSVSRAYWDYLGGTAPAISLNEFIALDSAYTEFVESCRVRGFPNSTYGKRLFREFEQAFGELRWSVPEFLDQNLRLFFP